MDCFVYSEIDFSCNKLKSVEECPDFPKLLRLSLWGNNMKGKSFVGLVAIHFVLH